MPAKLWCHWSIQDNRVLIETLVAQKAAGNQAQSGWKSTTWSVVTAELKKADIDCEVKKTPAKCSDHYANVRARYTSINANHWLSTHNPCDSSKPITCRSKGSEIYQVLGGMVEESSSLLLTSTGLS